MSAAELAAVILAGSALLTALAQLWVAIQTHGKVDTQVHQTNGLTANIAELNRTLGRAEGRAAAAGGAAATETDDAKPGFVVEAPLAQCPIP